MGNIEADAIDWAVENDIAFYVFDLTRLANALKSAQAQNKMARIHIELETGMNRTGMNAQVLCKALEIVNSNKNHLVIEGVCDHFGGAENAVNHNRVTSQMERFNELKKIFGEYSIYPGTIHTSCSAGMINYPQYNHDLVRIGIMNYGFWPNKETKKRFMKLNGFAVSPLKRIISWKSRIMSVQHIGKDEYIGYCLSYRTNQPMVIAIVPVGYAHGYDRSLSNLGHVLIKGRKAPITGIVNMNCIAVDITTLPAPMPGDEVVLIGRQGNHEITVNSFSETLHVLNYELLTRLPRNIPRIIIRNGIPDAQ
jgi:alanine racemase